MDKRKRNVQVKFYMSEDEIEKLDAKVKKSGQANRGAYLRKAALENEVVNIDMSGIRKLTQEINAIGTNINQIAHLCNIERSVPSYQVENIREYMEKIWRLLRYTLSSLQSAKRSTT